MELKNQSNVVDMGLGKRTSFSISIVEKCSTNEKTNHYLPFFSTPT